MIYLANYATQADVECRRDDCGCDTVEDLAYPLGIVLMGRDEGHVQALLNAAARDHALDDNGDHDPSWVPDWTTEGWQPSERGPEYGRQVWSSASLECVVTLCSEEPLEPIGGPQ